MTKKNKYLIEYLNGKKVKGALELVYVDGFLSKMMVKKLHQSEKVIWSILLAHTRYKEIDLVVGNDCTFLRVQKLVVESTPSLHRQCIDVYYEFYLQQIGVLPRINAVEGSAMNRIIAFFRKQSQDDKEVLNTWNALLENWHLVDPFYQKQLDLKQINSNLNAIIRQVKNGTSQKKHGADALRSSI